MSQILDSLIEHRESLNLQMEDEQRRLEQSKFAYEETSQKVKALGFQLKEVSIAISALEKSAKAAEEGIPSEGNGYSSPFRRGRRNVREMVRSALEHADHPMTDKELMQAVEATKISVNGALTYLVQHNLAIPLERGWILKSKEPEYQDNDDDEEEGEETSDQHSYQVGDHEHTYE